MPPHSHSSPLPPKSIYPSSFPSSFKPPSPSPSPFPFRLNFLLLLFSMASSFLLLSSLLFLSLSPSHSHLHSHSHSHSPPKSSSSSSTSSATSAIQLACRATRYPDTCLSMLTNSTSSLPPSPSPNSIIASAFATAAINLITGQSMVHDILSSSARDQNRSRAAQTCLEVLSMSSHRASSSASALSLGNLRDSRAWASAALSYQYDCWSGLKYVNDSSAVNATMSFFDTVLIVSTSNALSMLRALDALGPDTRSWTPPRTERDGFWEPIVGSSDVGPQFNFAGLVPDATVCKDGSDGGFTSVQAAVDAAPENLEGGKRYVIKIKKGVYDEIVRVGFNKTNLVFLGDGIGNTVITGSLSTGLLGITTYNTATVGILGDGFMASGLTIQNTAGPDAHQAVAFRSDSDFSYIENCEFLGNQDTVYIHSLRQLFKSCRIEGNVDFIFGNAAAIFQDCTILVRPRQVNPEKGETNAIAAHGRTDPAQTTGFAFLGCLINGTDDYMNLYNSKPTKHKNYLGRPWKMYSRTVYVNCTMESLITPQGWLPWSGDFALSTLYYGEFGNSGPGANISSRVPWSRQIPEEHVSTFYVQNFLQGDEWITTTS